MKSTAHLRRSAGVFHLSVAADSVPGIIHPRSTGAFRAVSLASRKARFPRADLTPMPPPSPLQVVVSER